MKKLMFAAAALAAGVVMAEGIQSANVVGYRQYTLSDEYTLFGMCFEDTAGGGMDLNTAIPYTTGMTKALSDSDADNIQVMGDDGKYEFYFLSNGYYGKGGKSYNAELDGKWLQTAGVACADKVKAGQAIWYMSKTAKTTPHTITVAGAVLKTAETDPKTCTETYTLIGNPFGAAIPLNGGVVTTDATKALSDSDADNIQVMGDDDKYSLYFLSNGYYGKGGKSYNAELDGKWLQTAGVECNDTIPFGRAIWYVSKKNTTTVKLINPVE